MDGRTAWTGSRSRRPPGVSFWTASGLHLLLKTLPGFQDGAVLEQIDSWKHLKIVTLATSENREAFTPRGGSAGEVSGGRLRSAELITRLGIEPIALHIGRLAPETTRRLQPAVCVSG